MLLPSRNARQEYFLNVPQFSFACPSEQQFKNEEEYGVWRNNPDKGKQKCWVKNHSQYPFVDHRFYVDWPIIEHETPQ